MKTSTIILTTALMLLAYASLSAASQSRPSDVINASLRGDRLVFATIDDYRRAVDEPSLETKQQFMRTVAALRGFSFFVQSQSLLIARQIRPSSRPPLIEDEYFASILNANLVVQIGEHIFRVDPARERVYVLPVANEAEYGDLIAGNVRNRNIRVFSTGDDVLEAIEEGGRNLEAFCSESGIGSKHSAVSVANGTLYPDHASAHFARYGIYFTLFAQVSTPGAFFNQIIFSYTFDFTGGIYSNQGHVYYKIRCGNTVDKDVVTQGTFYGSVLQGAGQKYRPYEGSKTLNKVYFYYRLKRPSLPSGGLVVVTPYIGFRQNKWC